MFKKLVIDFLQEIKDDNEEKLKNYEKQYLMHLLGKERRGLIDDIEMCKGRIKKCEYLQNRIEELEFIHTDEKEYMTEYGTFSDGVVFEYTDKFLNYRDTQKKYIILSNIVVVINYSVIKHGELYDKTRVIKKLIDEGLLGIDIGARKYAPDIIVMALEYTFKDDILVAGINGVQLSKVLRNIIRYKMRGKEIKLIHSYYGGYREVSLD